MAEQIKASDLRIGNYLIVNNPEHRPNQTGQICIVNEVKTDNANVSMLDYLDDFGQFYKFLSPIPLSEDVLSKCEGLFKTTENAGNLPCFKVGDITIARWGQNKFQVWYKTVDLKYCPQYLHELQNIVSALTLGKTEIIFKP